MKSVMDFVIHIRRTGLDYIMNDNNRHASENDELNLPVHDNQPWEELYKM